MVVDGGFFCVEVVQLEAADDHFQVPLPVQQQQLSSRSSSYDHLSPLPTRCILE